MTQSLTLISASNNSDSTASLNATTWSTTDKTSATVLSCGNLKATQTNPPFANGSGRSVGAVSGKKYFELQIDSTPANIAFGVVSTGYTLGNVMTNSSFCFFYRSDGLYGYNSSNIPISSNALTSAAGNNLGCMAIDMDNLTAWVRKGSSYWNGSSTADPATNTGGRNITGINGLGSVYPAWRTQDNGASVQVIFASTSWNNSAPSGFSEITST